MTKTLPGHRAAPVNNDADDLSLLAASAADYCARSLEIGRLRALRPTNRSFDPTHWATMVELGWAALIVPEARGGAGFGAMATVRVCRELGRVVAPEPMLESAVSASAVLLALDNDDGRIAHAMTGAVHTCPLNAAAWLQPSIAAQPTAAGWKLRGAIHAMPLLSDAEQILVPARHDDATHVFMIERALLDGNMVITPQIDGGQAGTLDFDDLQCADSAHLGVFEQAAPACALALALSAVATSGAMLGLCEALFERTLEYLRTRHQFGRAIGSFQALQHRAVDMYTQIRLASAALDQACDGIDQGSPTPPALIAQRALARASATTRLVLREAIQMHGAIGYTEENDVALFVWRGLALLGLCGEPVDQLKRHTEFRQWFVTTHDDGASSAASAPTTDPVDSDWNALTDTDFRGLVRSWFGAHYPPELRHLPYQLRWEEIRHWHTQLVDRGWAAPAWPRQYGGMGLDPGKLLIFIEELERHGVARAPDQGIVMVGPILFEYGNEEQKARYLRPALTGEHIWCQGYSEPNAGSDLASLMTRAEPDGEGFVVNGQKTWTTHALDATHMYCLVRTDPAVKPQAGISFVLIDLDQPGIDIRPIANLSGHVDFCEVFLDNVHVSRDNLIGEINQGWTIAKTLLGHERLFVGSPKLCQHALNQLRQLGARRQLDNDPLFIDQLTRATLDVLDLEALYAEFAALLKRGEQPGADVALLKLWSTETYARLSEFVLAAAGPAAALSGADPHTGVDALGHYFSARPAPIYAGSNEIQRNIVAKLVLDLPT